MFLLIVMFTTILSVALVVVYFITNHLSYMDNSEKMTAFECGFDPLSKMRSPFSTRFFLLVVLFLIFDVEIALIFPVLSMFSNSVTIMSSSSLIIFMLILLFGMFHEWNEGALDWFTK